MNKIHIITILIAFSFTVAFSQEENPYKFGEISQEELDMKVYDKDPEAEAVIIFDFGESYFYDKDGGYDIRFTRTKRIKILKPDGVGHAEVSIPYYVDSYGTTERIASIKAFTYNYESGKQVKQALQKSAIFEEQITNNWRVKKFTFPNVKVGSIVEFEFVKETPFHFNLPDWEFQDDIPTLYSRYTARMIPFYEYVFRAQGIVAFDYKNSVISDEKRMWGTVNNDKGTRIGNGVEFKDYIHTFVKKHVPAFKSERYITSREDYIMKMDFQWAKFHSPSGRTKEIITTWPKMSEDFLKDEDFGKFIKASTKLGTKILESELDLSGKSEIQKVKAIIEYVKSGFSWNNDYGLEAKKSAKEFLKLREGRAAEINLFMIGMLKAAGIDAQPVLISTRKHGKVDAAYPFQHLFNYLIVKVNSEKSFLTDGTESILAYNRLPIRCINSVGLVIQKGEPQWVQTTLASHPSINRRIIRLRPDFEELSLQCIASLQTTEYIALDYKKSCRNDTTKLKDLFEDEYTSNVRGVSSFNYEKDHMPYSINFTSDGKIEQIGGKYIIKPFLNFPIQKNYLTQKSRTYPIDFIYVKSDQFESTLSIPDGYKILTMPKAYSIENEYIKINLTFDKKGNALVSKGDYIFKKSIYAPNEYVKVKYYFNQIVKKFNQEVVLEKI